MADEPVAATPATAPSAPAQAATPAVATPAAPSPSAGAPQASNAAPPAKPAAAAPAKPADAKPKEPAAGVWPDAWRLEMARGDKSRLDELERLGSPADVYDALRALRQKVSSGELKSSKLAKDATPEQIAAYRKEHDVPEKAEGYYDKISLPDGLVIGEEDKPIVNEVLAAAHAKHAPPEIVSSMVAAYYRAKEAEQAAQDDSDLEHKATSEDDLRKEWGPEYRTNVNIVKNFLTNTFGEGAARILGARLADGKPLGNDPEVLRPLLRVAREINPVATVVGHAGAATPAGVQDRISQIEKLMGDWQSEYYKGPKSEALQKEFRDLIDARNRMGVRRAA